MFTNTWNRLGRSFRTANTLGKLNNLAVNNRKPFLPLASGFSTSGYNANNIRNVAIIAHVDHGITNFFYCFIHFFNNIIYNQ